MADDMLREYEKNLSEGIRDDFAGKKISVIRTPQGHGAIGAMAGVRTDAVTILLAYPHLIDESDITRQFDIAEVALDRHFIIIIDSFGQVPARMQEEILSRLTERPANVDAIILATPGTVHIPDGDARFCIHGYIGGQQGT